MAFQSGFIAFCLICLISCTQEPDKVLPQVKSQEIFDQGKMIPYGNVLSEARARANKEMFSSLAFPTGKITVPFVSLGEEGRRYSLVVNIDTIQAEVVADGGLVYSLPEKHIPISIVSGTSGSFFIFSKMFPTTDLYVTEWNMKVLSTTLLQRDSGSYLFFRSAVSSDDGFDIVVYDNITEKNYLWRMARQKSGKIHLNKEILLPSLNPPAGSHYEMEPKVFLTRLSDNSLSIVGGDLTLAIAGDKLQEFRLKSCARVLEIIVLVDGVQKLCEKISLKSDPQYLLFDSNNQVKSNYDLHKGIPFRFKATNKGKISYTLAKDPQQFLDLYTFDISRSLNSGILDLGVSNSEGRIPWSQVYYLNGFLDIFWLASRDDQAWDIYQPILKQLHDRIFIETSLLVKQIEFFRGMKTKGFTVGRHEAVFAVQTSRVLLLLNRVIDQFGWTQFAKSRDRLAGQVMSLKGHIDVLATEGESEKWIAKGTPYLKWPTGSSFYYDGAPVPYNHQNEWAYGIIDHVYRNVREEKRQLAPQKAILDHFLRHVMAIDGSFPEPENWFYWWGRGYEGWEEGSGVSVNMPSYAGDKYQAWVSFRTIDLMSILEGNKTFGFKNKNKILDSAKLSIERGVVYPFAARALIESSQTVALKAGVAYSYARSLETWEIASSPWALVQLSKKQE